MKNALIIVMAALLPIFFLTAQASTKKAKPNDLTGYIYSYQEAGLKLVFFSKDVVDVFAGKNASPLSCKYKYNVKKNKGTITMPGSKKPDYEFTMTSERVMLNLETPGKQGIIPMRRIQ
ncbi:MAG: hypothetical protein LBC89_04955 [Bacteroidales bacterium]|jgi:hypothetical protein|nr:hypothetical protein [Bacteroidales bacterium]